MMDSLPGCGCTHAREGVWYAVSRHSSPSPGCTHAREGVWGRPRTIGEVMMEVLWACCATWMITSAIVCWAVCATDRITQKY